jgi:predicted DNA-binding protein YlxM (UPF0122 family)
MDNVYEISLLLDFYGQLLTTRQYEILDLHYNNDYSLGEIADQLNISRQGVFDNIKRAKATLNEFETKLGLVEKFNNQRKKAQETLNLIQGLNKEGLKDSDKEIICSVEKNIKGIIEDF